MPRTLTAALLALASSCATVSEPPSVDAEVRVLSQHVFRGVSQTDGTAGERTQMQPQTLVEHAPIDALDILGGDASVTALNVDAPAFCPVSTMAPPPPRVLAPAPAATGPKDEPEP